MFNWFNFFHSLSEGLGWILFGLVVYGLFTDRWKKKLILILLIVMTIADALGQGFLIK